MSHILIKVADILSSDESKAKFMRQLERDDPATISVMELNSQFQCNVDVVERVSLFIFCLQSLQISAHLLSIYRPLFLSYPRLKL